MKYTYNDIKNSLTKKKNSRSSLWVQLWVRKASFSFTYIFINLGWTANMVSVLSWIIIFIASVLFSINSFWCMFIAAILTNFWLVLDCVDGNIARVKKVKTFMGDFYDAVAGYGPFAFTTFGLGMAAYHTTNILSPKYSYIFIIIGAIGAILNTYTRLIHQKYLTCYFAGKNRIGELDDIDLTDTDDKKSFAYIREQIDKNFGVAGLFMPWLFVALFTDTFDVMVTIYTLYYTLSFIAVCVLYCKKAKKFESYAQMKINSEKGKK